MVEAWWTLETWRRVVESGDGGAADGCQRRSANCASLNSGPESRTQRLDEVLYTVHFRSNA